MQQTLNLTSMIEHKHEGLPRFVCVPMSKVDPWKLKGTTTVEVNMNGVDIGRRSLIELMLIRSVGESLQNRER